MNAAFDRDPYLLPFKEEIQKRVNKYQEKKQEIETAEGCSLLEFAGGYKLFGLNRQSDFWVFREYLPNAISVSVFGEFNGWDRDANICTAENFGRWTVNIPCAQMHPGSKYRMCITGVDGVRRDRVPAYAKAVKQEGIDGCFNAVVIGDDSGNNAVSITQAPTAKSLRIYEAHVGMSSEEGRVSSYSDFRKFVLPRIVNLGYTAVQFMAIQEHAYYGSFGYHVTSFFAPSSRSNDVAELKELVRSAQEQGLVVLMDLVHSHASDNFQDGIADLDGGASTGKSGPYTFPYKHPLWDSAMFDYSRWETLRFLLSNVRYWIEEIGFDGFRFDGVTSMLYKHHGVGVGFSGDYKEYFCSLDEDAAVYLMLANDVAHQSRQRRLGNSMCSAAVTIAEDVSGMPLLCRPVDEGGFGFDYRLGMAIPDEWIKCVKEKRDEDWSMGHLVHTLTNRRYLEKTIAYVESHDQAIVGDKTIMMWLLNDKIYTDMSALISSDAADRAVALHKLIRLLTFALGGEGYLNFMGNEFGHPEWVDFPRKGNNWSYHWCRRQWSLADSDHLRYKSLLSFDKAMQHLDSLYDVLLATDQYVFESHEEDKIIVFEKGGLLFVFNFHPSKSFPDRTVRTRFDRALHLVLDSDLKEFAGFGRIDHHHLRPINGQVQLYIPSRTALVYCPL